MKMHPPHLSTSAIALLFALLAAPVRADIVYMANTDWGSPFGANYLEKFTSGGLSSQFANLSGVGSPFGLAFDSAANLYVAMNYGGAPNAGTIMRFTPDGVGSVYLSGLWAPTALAFDSAGNLFVADNGTIKKFTPDGTESVFASGVGSIGMAFDFAGNLYAADNSRGTILKFSLDGNSTVFASGLNAPEGLSFDSAGNLFVVNIGDRTVSKFTPGGVGSVFVSSGLVNPVGAAFDSVGNLYVGDADGIKEFTPEGVGSVFAAAPYANGYPSCLAPKQANYRSKLRKGCLYQGSSSSNTGRPRLFSRAAAAISSPALVLFPALPFHRLFHRA